MKFFSPTENWFNFCVLLTAIFLLKGIVYLSVIPPFEGWDEFQHLAYIVHLDEHGEQPILNKAKVSRELLKQIAAFPASQAMLQETRDIGNVDYKTFYAPAFSANGYNENHADINLYQSQHGSLYYWLMLPVINLFDREAGILNTIFVLRLINILFATASMAILMHLIGRIVAQKTHGALLAILLISQPLLLINSCRVANDSLAIFIGTVVIAIGLRADLRKRIVSSVVAGTLIGLSCWAKSTSTILFPFWVCCLLVSFFRKEISFPKMLVLLAISNSIAIVVLSEYFIFNIDNYGMLFVMQEAIVNNHQNKSFFDIIRLVFDVPVANYILSVWFKRSIWIGGWSFLKVSYISNTHAAIITFSLLGWVYNYYRKSTAKGIISFENSLLCFSTCFFTSLALSWHYLQSSSAWGQAYTCPWYMSLSLPFFLIFIYDSASRWSAKTACIVGALLTAVYIYADVMGSLTMLSFYSGGAKIGGEALSRIAVVHPTWLGTPTLLVAALTFTGLLVFSLCVLFYFLHRKPSSLPFDTAPLTFHRPNDVSPSAE